MGITPTSSVHADDAARHAGCLEELFRMLTGPDFHEEHVLDDGSKVTLRHIHPEDAAELKRGFERLSPLSRYRRFLGGCSSLSDETLHYLTCVDGKDHVALVATRPDPATGAEVGLGIARFVRDRADPAVAEAAITVVDDAQQKGLGRILGLAIAHAAVERGVKRFRGEILTDNEPVRQLLDEVGAIIRPNGGGSLVFDVELVPPSPAPGRSLDVVVRKFLRSAASFLAGLIRSVGPPAQREAPAARTASP